MEMRELRGPTMDSALTDGTLHIAAPLREVRQLIQTALSDAGVPFSEPHQGILAIALKPGLLELLSVELAEWLSMEEMQGCLSFVLPEGATASLADLARVQPLSTLLGPLQRRWLFDLVGRNGLTSHFQPIVHMANPETVYAYECLLRGREADGQLISPKVIFDAARDTGILCEIDRIAQHTAIQCSRWNQIEEPIFINVNPGTMSRWPDAVAQLVDEAASAHIPCNRITLEIVETDRVVDPEALETAISECRRHEFRIALDDVGAGYNSLNLLSRLKPDLIKIDVELVRHVDSDPYKAEIASKLLEASQNLGVGTIAEGIESEQEWRWFWQHGADYGQGYAFARPAPVPPASRVPVGSGMCA